MKTLNNKKVLVTGASGFIGSHLYIDDLVDACLFLMESCDYKDIREFVNIGTGEDVKIKDLAILIKDMVGFNGEIRYDPSKPDGTPKKLLDISKIKTLGWESKVSLQEGINKTIKYYSDCISL